MRLALLIVAGIGAGILAGFLPYAVTSIRMHQTPWVQP